MDIDVKTLRFLRWCMEVMKYGIYIFLIGFIVFCSLFVFLRNKQLDIFFIASFIMLYCVKWYRTTSLFLSPHSDFLLNDFNVHLKVSGASARYPTDEELGVFSDFCELIKIPKPVLFTCDTPAGFHAYIYRFQKTIIILISEQMYHEYYREEIYAVFAHEFGHLENHDYFLGKMERWLFMVAHSLSVFTLVKVVWFAIMLGSNIDPYAFAFYFLTAIYFLDRIEARCQNLLSDIKEIKADFCGVEKLQSVQMMIDCLRKTNSVADFPRFAIRERSLLLIQKKD